MSSQDRGGGPRRSCLSAVTGREEPDPRFRAPLRSPQNHPGSSKTDAALAPPQINEGRDAGFFVKKLGDVSMSIKPLIPCRFCNFYHLNISTTQ